ncbi:hypothetical protein IU450_35925 [Nocardia abscessus]|uniref:hypothetical protein n=1 Tax=Nocardia abscessus TaxID=120957 RepID=UPI0018936082|nr:hypothetical protein [Nocardia abscessus]MBF6341231.1 hypothetical protein [Nocardia abscessus]
MGIVGGLIGCRSTQLAERANNNSSEANSIAREASQRANDVEQRQRKAEESRRAENVVIFVEPIRLGTTKFVIQIANYDALPVTDVTAVMGLPISSEPELTTPNLPGCHSITGVLSLDRPLDPRPYGLAESNGRTKFTDSSGNRWSRTPNSPPFRNEPDPSGKVHEWIPSITDNPSVVVSFDVTTAPIANVTCQAR